MKKCCACQKEKSLESFWKNKQTKDGHDGKCIICKRQKKLCVKKREKRPKPSSEGIDISFGPIKKNDWIQTFLFLKKIGYDLTSEKTIHEQFCEKHNLKPKKKGYDRVAKKTPKDFNLS